MAVGNSPHSSMLFNILPIRPIPPGRNTWAFWSPGRQRILLPMPQGTPKGSTIKRLSVKSKDVPYARKRGFSSLAISSHRHRDHCRYFFHVLMSALAAPATHQDQGLLLKEWRFNSPFRISRSRKPSVPGRVQLVVSGLGYPQGDAHKIINFSNKGYVHASSSAH
jgi:hypothetical protein